MSDIQYSVNKIDGLRAKIKAFILQTILLAKKIPNDNVGKVFTNQLLRSATSIGANFEESVEAESPKDIIHKLAVVRKEAKETGFWLDLIQENYIPLRTESLTLTQESQSLVRIFSSIISKKRAPSNTVHRIPNTHESVLK